MRKTISKALALLLVMALILSFAAVASAATTVYASQAVNVRSGPGTSYPIVGILDRGDSVTATGKKVDGWVQIQFSQYVSGYVLGSYLTDYYYNYNYNCSTPVYSSPCGVSLKICTDCGGTYYATTALNVRSGPGTKYPVIASLAKKQQVTKIGQSGNWYKLLTTDGTTAYASSRYLKAVSGSSSSGSTSSTDLTYTGTSGTAYYTTTALNVRSGPGTGYSVIDTLGRNEQVIYLGASSGKWMKVRTRDGVVGFCSSSYLTTRVTTNNCKNEPNYGYYCGACGRTVYYGSSCGYCGTGSYYTGGSCYTYPSYSSSCSPRVNWSVSSGYTFNPGSYVTLGSSYSVDTGAKLYAQNFTGSYVMNDSIPAGTTAKVTSMKDGNNMVGVTLTYSDKTTATGYIAICDLNY